MKVLISAPYMIRDRDRIRPLLDGVDAAFAWADVDECLSEKELLPLIEDVDVIICGDDDLSERVLDRANRLKAIIKWGTGIDSIDTEAAEERGIPVFNSPEAFTEPVADTTLGLMLDLLRHITVSDRLMKEGRWDKPRGTTLGECTVGMIGVGHIGSAVAKRLAPFNPDVLLNDLREIPDAVVSACRGEVVDKERIYAEADLITLHCDLNDTSHHLLSDEEFSLMADNAPRVINTARGPLIDEAALIRALREGAVRGAGLDVFEEEPLPASSPLREMDRVLLSSHNANSSQKHWDDVHENCISFLYEIPGVNP